MANAYGRGLFTGLGASTLKALRELRAGGDWSLVGRTGEYGAGNGAAMRMAPFAFWEQYSLAELSDFCRITHHQPDAYAGALAVVLAIRASLAGHWTGSERLLALLLPQLPDTRVRDRLLEIEALPGQPTIADVSRLGTSGYVVDSVPFALFCASQVPRLGLRAMLAATIAAGGDTDTNASLARQVAGALLGQPGIPAELLGKLKRVEGYDWLQRVVQRAQQLM
jgi:ADP-ribosylglycohydrolase